LNNQANELRNNEENIQYNAQITEQMNLLNKDIELLEQNSDKRKANLLNNLKYLQFYWKTDVIESWINEKIKQLELANNDLGYNLSTIQNLIAKHDTFEAGLQAFEQNEGINALNELKEQLLNDPSITDDRSSNINSKYNHIIECWSKLKSLSQNRFERLREQKGKFKDIDELYLKFAKKASSFNSWFENAEEDLTDPVRCNSIEEINELLIAHDRFQGTLNVAKQEFEELKQLDAKIKSLQVGPNPYTWFTMETLKDTWRSLEKAISDRKLDLDVEKKRQEENDTLRQKFAKIANEFYSWLQQTRTDIIECASVTTTLEEQLNYTKQKSQLVKDNIKKLKAIEELNLKLEELLILDNKYTEHSTLSLAQAYDQLNQLGLRMQHNLEQQIQARNQSGVSEESLREFSMMFKHFDKNKSGKLDHDEFKSCLRALGYDLPINEDQQKDVVFEQILDKVDPNRDGHINLQEYMAFMISRETENISSISDVIAAFKALTESSDRPYITREELAANLSPELTDYCIRKMRPYRDKSGREILNAYDYEAFTHELFNAS
jgi:spectrin alpha